MWLIGLLDLALSAGLLHGGCYGGGLMANTVSKYQEELGALQRRCCDKCRGTGEYQFYSPLHRHAVCYWCDGSGYKTQHYNEIKEDSI